jgi:hypothetical protein
MASSAASSRPAQYVWPMRYDEITQMVVGSDPENWHVLDVGSGPLYLNRLGEVSDAEHHWLEVDSHYYLAVYEPDVGLRIAWGMSIGDEWENEEKSWVFPDRTMYRFAVDAFWQGALVARWTLLGVDGGLCYLPDADREIVQADSTPQGIMTIGWLAKSSEIAVARLVDGLTGHREFDRFFRQARITEVPDE